VGRLGIAALLCGLVAIAAAGTWAGSVGSTLSLVAFLFAAVSGWLAAILGFIGWHWADIDPEVGIRRPAALSLVLAFGTLVIILSRFFTLELN